MLFQRQFKILFTADPKVVSLFTVPIAQMLHLLCVTLVIALVCIGSFSKGRSIQVKIFGIVMFAFVCTLFAASHGTVYPASFSSLHSIADIAHFLSNIASSLALVSCGMSIAVKELSTHP